MISFAISQVEFDEICKSEVDEISYLCGVKDDFDSVLVEICFQKFVSKKNWTKKKLVNKNWSTKYLVKIFVLSETKFFGGECEKQFFSVIT